MGKLGKETKNLLLAITVICLISFLLAAGLSFLLAKDFQHEMLLHDYGVSGYQLNHEDKLQISAFTAHPNESDIERGKEALASIGYSEATSMQLLPTVREYRNQTMLYLFLLLLFLFGMVYLVLLFYLRRQHRAIDDAGSKIREFLDGNSMSRPVIGIAFSMMSMKWRLFSPPMQRARSRQRSSYRTSFRMYHIRLKRRYLL